MKRALFVILISLSVNGVIAQSDSLTLDSFPDKYRYNIMTEFYNLAIYNNWNIQGEYMAKPWLGYVAGIGYFNRPIYGYERNMDSISASGVVMRGGVNLKVVNGRRQNKESWIFGFALTGSYSTVKAKYRIPTFYDTARGDFSKTYFNTTLDMTVLKVVRFSPRFYMDFGYNLGLGFSRPNFFTYRFLPGSGGSLPTRPDAAITSITFLPWMTFRYRFEADLF